MGNVCNGKVEYMVPYYSDVECVQVFCENDDGLLL